MANIVVVEYKNLSKQNKKRYVVVDKDTGEVLDNAQGYGYKTIQGAYAAYGYINRDKSKDEEKQARKKQIEQWMEKNKNFVEMMDTFSFEIAKGSWSPDDKFDTKFVDKMLSDNNIKVDFTAGELLRVWKNR